MSAVVATARRTTPLVAASPVPAPLTGPGDRLFWVGSALAQAGDQLQVVALAALGAVLTV